MWIVGVACVRCVMKLMTKKCPKCNSMNTTTLRLGQKAHIYITCNNCEWAGKPIPRSIEKFY